MIKSQIKSTHMHSTCQSDNYHFPLSVLSNDAREAILKGDLECESSSYTCYKWTAFLRGEIELETESGDRGRYEYEIHIWGASDEDLRDCSQESEDQDLEETFRDQAGEAFACVDMPGALDVYVELIEDLGNVHDTQPNELNNVGNTNGRDVFCKKCGEPWENAYILDDWKTFHDRVVLGNHEDDPDGCGKKTRITAVKTCPACEDIID